MNNPSSDRKTGKLIKELVVDALSSYHFALLVHAPFFKSNTCDQDLT